MQVNTITIEADQYRDLVSENAILCERMNHLLNLMDREVLEENGKEPHFLNFAEVKAIVNYKIPIDIKKELKKRSEIKAAEEVSRDGDLV